MAHPGGRHEATRVVLVGCAARSGARLWLRHLALAPATRRAVRRRRHPSVRSVEGDLRRQHEPLRGPCWRYVPERRSMRSRFVLRVGQWNRAVLGIGGELLVCPDAGDGCRLRHRGRSGRARGERLRSRTGVRIRRMSTRWNRDRLSHRSTEKHRVLSQRPDLPRLPGHCRGSRRYRELRHAPALGRRVLLLERLRRWARVSVRPGDGFPSRVPVTGEER